jgi:hypothetical protein
MANESSSIGQQLLDVPMGDMIRQMAFAIADAQVALDRASMDVAAMMSGHTLVLAADGTPEKRDLGEGYAFIGGKTYRDTRVYFGFTEEVVTPAAYQRLKLTLVFDTAADPPMTKAELTTADVFTNTDHPGITWRPLSPTTIRAGAMTVQVICDTAANYSLSGDWVAPLEGLQVSTHAILAAGKAAVTKRTPSLVSMMELGFTPTFYQFVDTIIEVNIAITITRDIEEPKPGSVTTSPYRRSSGSRVSVRTTPVEGMYSQKYSYSAEGSSLLRTKLVPIPPPAILEERIRMMLDANKANPKTNKTEP